MRLLSTLRWIPGALGVATALAVLPASADVAIAGLRPDVRPEGAPRIESVDKEGGWYRDALTGVSSPYPQSLRFLEAQGNWNTPFSRPGMTGRYDLRGWHRDPVIRQESDAKVR